MAKFSNELLNQLTEFLIHEIDTKVLDGITYTFLLKEPRYQSKYERYMKIRDEVKNCGYGPQDIFRVYEVGNGYIFDMDLNIAKRITTELSKAVVNSTGNKNVPLYMISDSPDKRRKRDMSLLANVVKKEFKAGKREIEVALFSKNSVQRIIITGQGTNGKNMAIKYNAYAIRHWDIQVVNRELLVPYGVRIEKIEPCEILPTMTGVRFILYLGSIE